MAAESERRDGEPEIWTGAENISLDGNLRKTTSHCGGGEPFLHEKHQEPLESLLMGLVGVTVARVGCTVSAGEARQSSTGFVFKEPGRLLRPPAIEPRTEFY